MACIGSLVVGGIGSPSGKFVMRSFLGESIDGSGCCGIVDACCVKRNKLCCVGLSVLGGLVMCSGITCVKRLVKQCAHPGDLQHPGAVANARRGVICRTDDWIRGLHTM